MTDVVIIGAGLSGLTCARRLQAGVAGGDSGVFRGEGESAGWAYFAAERNGTRPGEQHRGDERGGPGLRTGRGGLGVRLDLGRSGERRRGVGGTGADGVVRPGGYGVEDAAGI